MNMTDISVVSPMGLPCVGISLAAQLLLRSVQRVAPFGSTVLVTGPSGTGKELIARQIHALSPRSAQLFVPVDCASMTGELMASQLFGHVKGAFTSADQGSLGCFRAADKGTIFLDEIGELPISLQSKLLRVIQERAVVPVGSHQAIPVDVRIVAATNRDLRHGVAAGNFREDLFYRLSVVTIPAVPLCERIEDIPVLSDYFLAELEAQGHPRHQLSPEARELLTNHEWPGNVRELKNVLEQAALESDDHWITSETVYRVLAPALRGQQTLGWPSTRPAVSPPAPQQPQLEPAAVCNWPKLEEAERRLIIETLQHTYYNKSAAARLLAISRQALIRKMTKLGISPPRS
jgi:transcriptional regulator with GAF, ATPase, and Fis domain